MTQPTFADLDYENKKRKTRREKFLERMDGLIRWEELKERIRPFYPKAGRGRRPYELSAMLRIHCVQLFYNSQRCMRRSISLPFTEGPNKLRASSRVLSLKRDVFGIALI